jgi:hypothetical protein
VRLLQDCLNPAAGDVARMDPLIEVLGAVLGDVEITNNHFNNP